MPRPVVTGQFNHVAIAAFGVSRAMLTALLPKDGDLVPDEAHPDMGLGSDVGVVSLVSMSAEHMRLWGIRWPGGSRFGEVCLRVHVRQADRRGVLHVRRYNSSGLWTWAGTRVFGEHCRKQTVTESMRQNPRTIRIEHSLVFTPAMGEPGPGQLARPEGHPAEYSMVVEAYKPVVRPDTRGVEHWLKETRWVFTPALTPARSDGRAGANAVGGVMVHEILHPLWSVYPEATVRLNVDFANLFGLDWGFLNGAEPVASVLALGSQVAVFGRRSHVQVMWGQRRAGRVAGGSGGAGGAEERQTSIRSSAASV